VMMAFCPSGILGLIERVLKAAFRSGGTAPALHAEGIGP